MQKTDTTVHTSSIGAPTLFERLHARGINPNKIAIYALLITFLIMTFFVLVIMFSMSLRPTALIYVDFWGLPVPPTFVNYQQAFGVLIGPMLRTIGVAFVSIVGITAFACPASYALARVKFPGRRLILVLVLALIMIPGPIQLTPNFILANELGLRGSLWGLVVFYIAGGQAFAIFLITTFFLNLDKEMFEAARIDGASEIQALLRVAIPLAWPIIMTVAILNFLSMYSDLIWPSLMLPRSEQTLMIALQNFDQQIGEFDARPDLGIRAAGYSIAVIPQLFLFVFAMKYFIQGLTSGAVKG